MRGERGIGSVFGMMALCVLASCHEDPAVPDTAPALDVTIQGTITDEGVECLALRDKDNELYTLAGAAGGYGPGDEVCVKGEISEFSTCMQGTTVAVEWIGPVTACD